MKKNFFGQFYNDFGASGVVFAVILVLFVGGFGGVFVERLVLPYFSTWPVIRNFAPLRSDTPILINRREEIRIIDNINQAEVVARAKNSLVTLYLHQGEFDSGNFRIDKTFSGTAVTNDGLILAPLANLKPGLLLTAVLSDGRVASAAVLAEDALTGLAILKIDLYGLAVLREGFSENLKAGERLIAIWSDENSREPSSVRVEAARPGTVKPSAVRVYDFGELNAGLEIFWPENFETPGAILVNSEGELMGINSVVSGQAITVRGEDIKSLLANFLDDEEVAWPRFPLEYQVLGAQQTVLFDLPKEHGILVKSGYSVLLADDFIYAVNETVLNERDSFQEQILSKQPGSAVKLKLVRDGEEKEVEIRL